MSQVTNPVVHALKCAHCSSPLRAEDFDLPRGWAKCSYCQALTTFATPATGSAARERPAAPLPPRMVLDSTERGIEIRRRWFTWGHLFLLCFCVVWDSFLVFWYSMALRDNAPWIMAAFPVLHVAVGIGLTYATFAGLLNTTRVRVERGELSIAHGPVPWLGNRTIDAKTIEALYTKERIHRGKNGSHSTFEVWAKSTDGRTTKLTAAGSEPESAIYIEQQVERALGLPDRPVAGEWPR